MIYLGLFYDNGVILPYLSKTEDMKVAVTITNQIT